MSQFLLPLIVLASYSFVLSRGAAYLVRVALLQSAALTLIGGRLTVLVALIVLSFLLARHQIRFSPPTLVALCTVAIVAAFSLSLAREDAGREAFASGSNTSSRLSATSAGFVNVLRGRAPRDLGNVYFARLDGNALPALALQAADAGYPSIGFASLWNDLRLAVPSFLFPTKLAVTRPLNDEAFIKQHFGLAPLNRLPTVLGTISTFHGRAALLLYAAILGGCFAVADRWLARATPPRTVLVVTLLGSALAYERAPSEYLLAGRGGLLIALFVMVSERLSRRSKAFVRCSRWRFVPSPLRRGEHVGQAAIDSLRVRLGPVRQDVKLLLRQRSAVR
ncbi:MAG TPA: hypothetical protein VK988_22045 [Acidimicrobiales bacterium]|nr:hypothetical protein [Acidimicrobiales bacterium]